MTDDSETPKALSPEQIAAVEAATFRRLIEHLREHPELQNRVLMDHAGFCRNSLVRWYRMAATGLGLELPESQARHAIYGMDAEEWRARFEDND